MDRFAIQKLFACTAESIRPPWAHISVECQRKERRAVMHSGFSITADTNGGSYGHGTRNG
jgi:hypothetical protein